MSDDRLKYIEVIGDGASGAGEDRAETLRAAFQAARRNAEVLAEEAGVRITGVQQIAEVASDGEPGTRDRARYRVRFGIEPAVSASGRAGFQASE
ncbi:MAG TPA: SIMPL domain-containing protein [Thermoanaerobaculia bacterium]|nr:SIMPL domain-containing protein [Thermoanaerobaculia bacterium]